MLIRSLLSLFLLSLAVSASADEISNVVAIDSGYGHSCALDAAGDVYCWGRNHEGQLGNGTQVDRRSVGPAVALDAPARAIAVGAYHTCALTVGGLVKCWGSNLGGQVGNGSAPGYVLLPSPVNGLDAGVVAISAGFNHTCAITATSSVRCWGTNDFGQLGDGTATPRPGAVDVVGLGNAIVAVSAGTGHTCALSAAGALNCWGWNATGQLGNNAVVGSALPVAVIGMSTGVASVSAGDGRTCAVLVDGSVRCWGRDFSRFPVQITNSGEAAEVDLGLYGFPGAVAPLCLRSRSGVVSCAGSNDVGQLGTNAPIVVTPLPIFGGAVSLDAPAAAIATGGDHVCALLVTGRVRCWGSNAQSALGDGSANTNTQPVPMSVKGFAGPALSVAAGLQHTCAVDTQGSVFCWGANSNNQLGRPASFQSKTPLVVPGLTSGAKAVIAGNSFSCALVGDDVKCWGINGGVLGDGGMPGPRMTPTSVVGLPAGITKIAAGNGHACALSAGGAVACWGANGLGQLGDGTNLIRNTAVGVAGLSSGVVDIAIGMAHSCAVLADGAVRCWGANTNGQLGNGTFANSTTPREVVSAGAKSVAAGDAHTCVLLLAGTVRCWGDNTWGQIGNGTAAALTASGEARLTERAAAIAAGGNRTCVVTVSGGAQCWGLGIYGAYIADVFRGVQRTPIDVVGLVDRIAALSVSGNHFCAITEAGAVQCWGNNSYGEAGTGIATYEAVPVRVVHEGSPRAIEFHNMANDHYFISADDQEVFAIDNGAAGREWRRTGLSFATGGDTPVCRFYGSATPGPNSHFFALEGFECAALRAMQFAPTDPRRATVPSWNFESYAFRATTPTSPEFGQCVAPMVPVFRAYNRGDVRGIDSNHRLTTSHAAIAEVVARGWVDEGVRMCVSPD